METAEQKRWKARVAAAKRFRSNREALLNEGYRLAAPWRRRIGTTYEPTILDETISDMLDATLQDAWSDFASDLLTMFTPPGEPWVTFVPRKTLGLAQMRAISEQTRAYQDYVFEELSRSTYYDAAYEFAWDLGNGTGAMKRCDYGADQPIVFERIDPADLIVEPGRNNEAGGRFVEADMTREQFETQYGKRFWPTRLSAHKPEHKVRVCDGFWRYYEDRSGVVWKRALTVGGETVFEETRSGEGAPDIIVARWRTAGSNPWGIGPAWTAFAPQRVLNEITALHLANLHKIVDPPYVYTDDGTLNPEGGIDAGDWVPADKGFEIEALEPKGRFDVSFFAQDDLRSQVRRALYQDRPEQRGDTPPTAFQWGDEAARRDQRMEMPRHKLTREWVIATVNSVVDLRGRQGVLPFVRLDDGIVEMVPQSPWSRGRAFERITRATSNVQMLTAAFPQQAPLLINVPETARALVAASGDEITRIRTDEEIDKMKQEAMAAAQQAGAINAQ